MKVSPSPYAGFVRKENENEVNLLTETVNVI